MKKSLSVLVALTAMASVGCNGDDGPTTVQVSPQARVRYFNASPDAPASTEAVFVDRVENAFTFRRVPFRGNSGEYQAVNVGQRQFRVFRALTAAGVDTAQVLSLDTTFTLEADKRYTILQYGSMLAARGAANAARVTVFEDTLPEPVAAGSIAIRVYHALAGSGPVDVAIAPRTAAVATGATAGTIRNVPLLGRSAYLTVPALPVADTSAFYRFIVTAAGTTAPAIVNTFPTLISPIPLTTTLSAAGDAAVAATATAPAQPARAGFRQGGSVLSAFIVPAGTTAATNTPSVSLVPDRPPPTQ
jgi:hypothetical protein